MLELFENESEANYKYTIFFTLAAFTGLRRGELLGLEWKDIDWENNLLSVVRTSEYTKEKGIYTDTPKTESSVRFIKLPPEVMQKLNEFQDWQNDYKAKLGTKWVECDRLFTKTDGSPMGMRQPYKYFERFCERTGMRFVNIHSFRHFNASVLINNGVDVKTVQGCLGHSCATTTVPVPNSNTKPKQYLPTIILISKRRFSRPYVRNLHHFFRRQHHIMNNQYKEQRKTLGRKAE